MDDQYRTKPQLVTAYRWMGDVIESYERPPTPADLRQRFPGTVAMVQVDSVTHGRPNQWLPYVWDLDKQIKLTPGSWVVQYQNNRRAILTDTEFQHYFELNKSPELDKMQNQVNVLKELIESYGFSVTINGEPWPSVVKENLNEN